MDHFHRHYLAFSSKIEIPALSFIGRNLTLAHLFPSLFIEETMGGSERFDTYDGYGRQYLGQIVESYLMGDDWSVNVFDARFDLFIKAPLLEECLELAP